MGTEAEQIYKSQSFKKKEDEKNFTPKKNFIHERAKFYLRTQRDGEPDWEIY